MEKGEKNWRQLTLYFKEIEENKEFKVELGGNYTKKYTHWYPGRIFLAKITGCWFTGYYMNH